VIRATPFVIAAAFWAFFGLLFASEIYLSMYSHGHSFARLAVSQLLVWELWALATPLIAWLCARAPLVPFTFGALAAHLALGSALTVLHLAGYAGITLALRTYAPMEADPFWTQLKDLCLNRFHSDFIAYVATVGALHAAAYHHRSRQRELDAARHAAAATEARLEALRVQLQPHFLFNTLHAVSGLVRQSRSDDALEMIAGLSELLRHALASGGVQEVPLQEELDLLERYLDIEQVRFSDRLRVTFDVAVAARGAYVPSLLLQPLVENAVRHGIARSATPGEIRIRAARDRDRFLLEVFNHGPALAPNPEGVGLRNTRERLLHLYGDRQRLTLEDAEGGVKATVVLPWREARP
jgi:two-component system, LytTR family, sensor kinase